MFITSNHFIRLCQGLEHILFLEPINGCKRALEKYAFDACESENTKFESDAVFDFNLDNTDDIRMNWFGALPVSLNSRLELKPSLRVMWRNDPALEKLPLFDTGGTQIGDVTTPLNEWDTIFMLALVVKFAPSTEG